MFEIDVVGVVIIASTLGLIWYLNDKQEEQLKNILVMIVLVTLVIGIVGL